MTEHLRRDDDNPSEMSPRDRSPVRTSSPRHPSGKDPWNQWTTYTLTLLQNKLLICLAGGELPPRLSLVSPKVFSPFCHRWSFRSLPLSPLACSVGDTSFPAQSSTWLHRYYLNWTKLDNAITKFNNEMHSADNWVLNPVILHYWQICLFWYCAVLCYNLYC